MSTIRYVFAKTAGTLAFAGGRYRVSPGEPWDASDPLVKAYPDLFVTEPAAVRSTAVPGDYIRTDDLQVERATRAPGERRTTRRAR